MMRGGLGRLRERKDVAIYQKIKEGIITTEG